MSAKNGGAYILLELDFYYALEDASVRLRINRSSCPVFQQKKIN
jgi:hypothetical protein